MKKSWEVQDRQTLFCSMHTMFLGRLRLHSQIRTTWNSNIDYDLSSWIGEQQCMQMDFWQFFRKSDICVILDKLSEIHWHAWLFSNPRGKVFFLLKSMGQICFLDLILLRTFHHGLESNHAFFVIVHKHYKTGPVLVYPGRPADSPGASPVPPAG